MKVNAIHVCMPCKPKCMKNINTPSNSIQTSINFNGNPKNAAKIGKTIFGAVVGGVIGFCIGGPVGAAAGATIGGAAVQKSDN